MNKDPGGHIWPDNEDRCLRCGLGAYEAEGMVCRGKTLDTPLHALERALRPTSSRPYPLAEDVLARLIAMGWALVPAPNARAAEALVEAVRVVMGRSE